MVWEATDRDHDFYNLKAAVENVDFENERDVEEFFISLTRYIWDHKMMGAIYDSYKDNTLIHGENGALTSSVDGIVKHTSEGIAAMPDMRTNFLEMHAVKKSEDEYRFVQVTYIEGTFRGPSKYGPSNNAHLNYRNNMCMCECLVQRENNSWKVSEEWCLGFDDFFKSQFADTFDQ